MYLHCGDVRLSNDLLLKDVLLVPSFKLNLISVSALSENSTVKVFFYSNFFKIQGICPKKMIGKGERRGDLYVFTGKSQTSYINKVTADMWHDRLGHLSFKRLQILKNKLDYISHENKNKRPCCICHLAKQRIPYFPSMNNMSSNAFDLIHRDIWGPFSVPCKTGHRFFLILVDDCTRLCWIFMLKCKSDVHTNIPRFCAMITNTFDTNIKAFRSDNAKELTFIDFFCKTRHHASILVC